MSVHVRNNLLLVAELFLDAIQLGLEFLDGFIRFSCGFLQSGVQISLHKEFPKPFRLVSNLYTDMLEPHHGSQSFLDN